MSSYVVITPARNEEAHLRHTILSMIAQTSRPLRWVIVNDGSTDRTGTIIDAAAKQHAWILPLHRPDRGFRKQGGGVIEAFYEGYALLRDPCSVSQAWDFCSFLVKFDADLSFEPDYFQRCLSHFLSDPQLGIGGGMICRQLQGRLVCESPGDPAFHVRGATKIYRRTCWDAIGGLLKAPGWDSIDEFKANMLGWSTRTFTDIPLQHHRFTGSADGTWNNLVKFGLANFVAGYHPLFMGAKCLKRMAQPPVCLGSAALAWGFVKGYFSRAPRVSDPCLLKYVREQQLNRLRNRPSLWGATVGNLARA